MKSNVTVGIIMGSDSDLSIMKEAADILTQFGITNEMKITFCAPEVHLFWQNMFPMLMRGE